jgi:hypothetical protein
MPTDQTRTLRTLLPRISCKALVVCGLALSVLWVTLLGYGLISLTFHIFWGMYAFTVKTLVALAP